MALVKDLRQGTGNFVDALGSVFAPWAPDTGVSEFIAGGPTLNTTAKASAPTVADYQPENTLATGGVYDSSGSQIGSSATGTYVQPTSQQTQSIAPTQTQQPQQTQQPRQTSFEDIYQQLYAGWDPAAARADWEANGRPMPGGQTAPQITQAQIDEVYNPAFSALSEQERMLREQFPQYQQEAEQQFGANKALAEAGRQSTLNTAQEAESGATRRSEDAISAARRMFQELQQANRQRFGGSSSAGQFASEIQGREFQSGRNAISRDLNQTVAQINNNRQEIEQNFQATLQQLQAQKQQQINQASRAFQERLANINAQRGELESNKAAMRLQELQNLRNQIFAINNQERQFQQQLEAQRQAAQLELSTYQQQLASSGGNIQAIGQGFSPTQTSYSGIGANNVLASPQQLTGQINQEDLLRGQILGSSQTNPNFANFGGRLEQQGLY